LCNEHRYFPLPKGHIVRRILLILALAALAISVMAVYAFEPTTPGENDPRTNLDANACFIGGSMVGKCDDSDLFWNAGWYLIRFEQGLITRNQVPDQYKWVLPKESEVSNPSFPTPTGKPL
jgi:hypothetical protein